MKSRQIRVFLIGLVVVLVLGAAVYRFAPELLLRLLDAQPQGTVEEVWAEIVKAATVVPSPIPTLNPSPYPTLNSTRNPARNSTLIPTLSPTAEPAPVHTSLDVPVHLLAPGYINIRLQPDETFAEQFELISEVSGTQTAVIRYREDALLAFCAVWAIYCDNPRFRVEALDFRADGLVVYANINVANLWWQAVGIALRTTGERTEFRVLGVIWNETLFTLTPDSPLARTTSDLLERGMAALNTLEIEIGTTLYHVQGIELDDDALTIVLSS